MKEIGYFWNDWRNREVTIYQDPDDKDMVFGVGFTEKFVVVSHDPKSAYRNHYYDDGDMYIGVSL